MQFMQVPIQTIYYFFNQFWFSSTYQRKAWKNMLSLSIIRWLNKILDYFKCYMSTTQMDDIPARIRSL